MSCYENLVMKTQMNYSRHYSTYASGGNVIQQNKTEGWIIDDSKDMRLYVGYSDGTPAFILSS